MGIIGVIVMLAGVGAQVTFRFDFIIRAILCCDLPIEYQDKG